MTCHAYPFLVTFTDVEPVRSCSHGSYKQYLVYVVFFFFFTCRLACAHGRTRSLSKRTLFDTYLRIRVRITTTRATPSGLQESVRSREAGLLV